MQNLISIRQRGWSGEHPVWHCKVLSLSFLVSSLAHTLHGGPILTIYMSNDILPCKDVLVGDFVDMLTHYESNP